MTDALSFEDQVLLAFGELAGDAPMPLGEFIEEPHIAAGVAGLLGVDEAFVHSPAFFNSRERLQFLAAMQELEDRGLAKSRGTMGGDAFATTSSGRARVRELRERERARSAARVREARTRVLDELKGAATFTALDLERLGRAGISMEVYQEALRSLEEDGLIERADDSVPMLTAGWRLTATGRSQAGAPASRAGDDGWREAARLKRELDLARQRPDTLIRDSELQRRVVDLLVAEASYDRAVREACVILESRVRAAIGAPADLVGTALMEQAFSPKAPKLKLSGIEAEQVGAMQLYRGLMAYHRNPAGHHVMDEFAAEEALRIVVWVDHLLALIAKALTPP